MHTTGLYLLISFLRGILVKPTITGSSIPPNTRSRIPMPSLTLLVRSFFRISVILRALIMCKEFSSVYFLMFESN